MVALPPGQWGELSCGLPAVTSATGVWLATLSMPSLKVTVPLGVPAPGATAATVAVNVTRWPKTDGLALA